MRPTKAASISAARPWVRCSRTRSLRLGSRALSRTSVFSPTSPRSRTNDAAGTLPYGDQRRLEIARALATDPKLLALDEPAAGMNATERIALGRLIRTIRESGVTLLLI